MGTSHLFSELKEYPRCWTVFIGTLNAVLSLVAASENAAIVFALFQCRSIHSAAKSLFYSLALSDFGVGMVEQPLQIAATGTGILQDVLNSFCSIQPTYATVAYFFCSVSFITMTAKSVDRYLDLYLRERYRVVLSVKEVNIILALMWIGSIIWAISRTWDIRINKISAIVIGFFSIVVTLF